MADLTIRNVPRDVHESLKEEALHYHRSLNTIAVQALREHVEKSRRLKQMAAVIEQMNDFREEIGRRGVTSNSVDLIRQDRER